jgi:hypothetical protein
MREVCKAIQEQVPGAILDTETPVPAHITRCVRYQTPPLQTQEDHDHYYHRVADRVIWSINSRRQPDEEIRIYKPSMRSGYSDDGLVEMYEITIPY